MFIGGNAGLLIKGDYMLTRPVYIYLLIDPIDNKIKYVGQSKDPHVRLGEHLADKTGNYKSRWIETLQLKRLEPVLQVIEKTNIDDAFERERYWISRLYILGCPLTNSEAQMRKRKPVKTKKRYTPRTIDLSMDIWGV